MKWYHWYYFKLCHSQSYPRIASTFSWKCLSAGCILLSLCYTGTVDGICHLIHWYWYYQMYNTIHLLLYKHTLCIMSWTQLLFTWSQRPTVFQRCRGSRTSTTAVPSSNGCIDPTIMAGTNDTTFSLLATKSVAVTLQLPLHKIRQLSYPFIKEDSHPCTKSGSYSVIK